MTVAAPAINEVFLYRVTKYCQGRPSKPWHNFYEARVVSAADTSDLVSLANNLGNMEAALHCQDVYFQKALVSTWVPDGTPYNPLNFMNVPLPLSGAYAGLNPEPIDMCLKVHRDVEFGNQGKLSYRRCLDEGDVVSPDGEPVAANPGALISRIADAVDAGNLGVYLIGGTSPLRLIMWDGNPPQRVITGLSFFKVGMHQPNNN